MASISTHARSSELDAMSLIHTQVGHGIDLSHTNKTILINSPKANNPPRTNLRDFCRDYWPGGHSSPNFLVPQEQHATNLSNAFSPVVRLFFVQCSIQPCPFSLWFTRAKCRRCGGHFEVHVDYGHMFACAPLGDVNFCEVFFASLFLRFKPQTERTRLDATLCEKQYHYIQT